ncbi:MAG: 1,4-alpha-glucan branching enzyme [Eubacterium sp.]|nr:1,4-alpha-glucan branching enzyme [Eubacterium sp.]
MKKALYELLDFPEIEAVIYSEEDQPRSILGPRMTDDGVLVQAYVPGEEKLQIRTLDDGKRHKMELVDESGFFAVLLPGSEIPPYELIRKSGGKEIVWKDPYAFDSLVTEQDEKRHQAGNLARAWEVLGAHLTTVGGVSGVSFAVWAPNAMRVSVVGDFNAWDGRVCQMNRLPSGIFELFVPGVTAGAHYQFELKLKGGMVYLKSDPYGRSFDLKTGPVSVVTETPGYAWGDSSWTQSRAAHSAPDAPLAICQMDFGKWCLEHGVESNYAAAAGTLAEALASDGFTHVELSPLMEYPDENSEGFETCGYYAPTARYGSAEDFMKLVDILHQKGIGIVLDFVASYFAGGNSLLAAFDGTFLYEHLDPRRGMHPAFGTHIFNYGRPEVCNFLIAASVYWAEMFHIDGFKYTDVATMLFQDYGRNEGEWVANMYGGNENLEAVEFLKKLNQVLHREIPGILTIAEEMAGWNGLTAPVEKDGIGFDYKWNHWWADEFLTYMHMDPLFRGAHQDDLTFCTVYAFSEKFLIGFGKDEAVRARGPFASWMAGNDEAAKEANLRLALAYITMHPGKKLLNSAVAQAAGKTYLQALGKLYQELPALHRTDLTADGFEWISNLDWERSLLIFLRKTEKAEDTLLVVCNFSNVPYGDVSVGVPYAGKYKEIFNSDSEAFGGIGVVNSRVKMSVEAEQDERPYSIKVKIPPLGISVYQYSEQVAKRSDNKAAKTRQASSAKKPPVTNKAAKSRKTQ